ncbi:MAG: hypothetical protein DDT42_00339 [candidate division WS2 bacterium]|uniref:Uncharacterized protein n=1 Tax=Psychracetigena formicireducens TaxID=2986056 RepID=A0A9E2BF69_PSYF1|nr:hypothetical protein [Candidatus Psychracetigena formicireducens]MBT9144498.1 hypothetical protein [Candidatus Psychracetigena formicireducens]
MGAHFLFQCKTCKYKAEVSGGVDFGSYVKVQTRVCSNCRKIVDVITGISTTKSIIVDVITGISKTKSIEKNSYLKEMEDLVNKCPYCKQDCTTPWIKPFPCPKCNSNMINKGITCKWD